MKAIFIENYRGKDIFYSTNSEKFYSGIDEGKEKNLIHLVRKDIDDYIKSNQTFKPFLAFQSTSFSSMFHDNKIVTVIGLRKDKALQCESGIQVSNYDLRDKTCTWFKLNTDTQEECLDAINYEKKQIQLLEEKIKAHRKNIGEHVEKMKGENLSDFRNRLIGEQNENN